MNRKQTAAQAYADTNAEIDLLIERLKAARVQHTQQAAAQPGNWEFAGDLGALRTNLQHALESLGG